jgi:hypothetical protein
MTELEGLRERLGLPADAPDPQVLARLADDPELRAELGTSPRPIHPTGCVPGPTTLAPTDYIPPRR